MELDFDKEIDILLRKSARDAPGVPAGEHLDADQISAFAENTVPDTARAAYVNHFGSCSRCRELLAISINIYEEAETEPASSIAVAATPSVPWYRSMFSLQPLAYTMGGLVLLLSGFIGYSLLQRGDIEPQNGQISQVYENEPTASGPNAGNEFETHISNSAGSNPVAVTNTNLSTATTANTAANFSIANTARNATRDSDASELAAKPDIAPPVVAAAPPPPPSAATADATVAEADRLKKPEAFAKEGVKLQNAERQNRVDESKQLKDDAAPGRAAAAPNAKSSALRRLESGTGTRSLDGMDTAQAPTRTVGGKTFQQRQGVWYDSSYRGQGTTSVRRGTSEYIRLDGGLRSVADRVSGTVVIVWGGKAYRIH